MRRWHNLSAEGNAGVISTGEMSVLVWMGGICVASHRIHYGSVHTCDPEIIISNVPFPFKGVPVWMINFAVILLMPQPYLPLKT